MVELFRQAADLFVTAAPWVAIVATVSGLGWYFEKARNGDFNDVGKPERPTRAERTTTTVSAGGPPVVR